MDELTALPRTSYLHLRGLLLKGKEENGREGNWKEKNGKGEREMR